MDYPEMYLVKDNLVLRLRGSSGIIGSSTGPQVQTLLNAFISGEHLGWRRLDQEHIEVEDLGSTNGTFIRGARLPPRSPLRVGLGGRLDLAREGDWILTDSAHRKATFMKGPPTAVLRRIAGGEAEVVLKSDESTIATLRSVQARLVLYLAEETPHLPEEGAPPPPDDIGWARRDEVACALYESLEDTLRLNNVLARLRAKLDELGLPPIIEVQPGGGRAAPGAPPNSGHLRLRLDGAWIFQGP